MTELEDRYRDAIENLVVSNTKLREDLDNATMVGNKLYSQLEAVMRENAELRAQLGPQPRESWPMTVASDMTVDKIYVGGQGRPVEVFELENPVVVSAGSMFYVELGDEPKIVLVDGGSGEESMPDVRTE